MRAAIYNPYLDTLGGGERYTLAFAAVLKDGGYDVEIEWGDSEILGKLEKKFGKKTSGLKIVKDIKRGDGYDLLFWVSDGSIPLLKARRNFLHFQFPFKGVGGRSLLNKMKFFRIEKCICNSEFTKKVIDEEYGVSSVVLYPPVDTLEFKPKKKEDVILYVGRFSRLTQAKRQDLLIKAFKKLYNKGFDGYRLILAGGTEVGVGDYTGKLRKLARTYPVTIIENPDFKELKKLYASSRIFWSAAGFGVDEFKEPIKVEHFGITLVEAMASGLVAFAYSAGGPREIIENGKNGFLWGKEKDLIKKTAEIIKDLKLAKKISSEAVKKSQEFSYSSFNENVIRILE